MRTSTIALSVVGFFSFACLSYAQEPVEKKSFNYSEWTKGLFAEAVTITGLAGAKAIYLGGIGAEEETGKPGEIRGAGDIAGQCAYTFEKISRVLGRMRPSSRTS
jgi:2-iminobutanoate/2-iminopropanoate deaminase